MNSSEALLAAGWALGRANASESISVYPDGGVWYWRTSAVDADDRDVAGTFKFSISDAELAQLSELAGRLGLEPDPGGRLIPNALEVRITTAVPVARSFAFSWVRDRPPPEALRLAWDLLRELAGRASRSPLAVLRLHWKARASPGQPGQLTTLMFGFANLGGQAIEVLIDPSAFRLSARSPGAGIELWRGSPEATVGLIGGGGAPLGGILSPALIGPGETATAVFPNAHPVAEPGMATVVAHAEGHLPLIKPDQPAPFPDALFVLETPPTPFTLA